MSVTSFKYGGTITSVARAGETTAWTNPSNAGADDTSYASITIPLKGSPQYLVPVNFGFSTSDIPSGSTIDGIEVAMLKREQGSSPTISDYAVHIVKGGTPGATNYALGGLWALSDTEYTYGGATDLWGETWADTDITAATFGVEIQIQGSPNVIGSIDYIKIRVYYTESGGTTRRIFIVN